MVQPDIKRAQVWSVIAPDKTERPGIVLAFIEHLNAALMIPVVSLPGNYTVRLGEKDYPRLPAFACVDVLALVPKNSFVRSHGSLSSETADEIDRKLLAFWSELRASPEE